jgi:hypothetical protein
MTMPVEQLRWTDRNIIDLIRKLRNDLIKDFLDERYMKEYVSEKYNIRELSAIRIEFIKQDLKGLLIAPVDVSHYKSLIKLIRETDTASLSEGNENLFFNEIESILKRHLF